MNVKRPGLILLLGLLGALAAFVVVYFASTSPSRKMAAERYPELAWLKKEFSLGAEEYNRIVALHLEYLPGCAERCRLIEEQNEKLRQLIAQSPAVTPEIEAVMAERARMRAECEAEMLRHFLAVSRTMPAEQGRRYLSWVEGQTFMKGEAMEQQHRSAHESHHH